MLHTACTLVNLNSTGVYVQLSIVMNTEIYASGIIHVGGRIEAHLLETITIPVPSILAILHCHAQVRCTWVLGSGSEALLSSAVFLGMLLGASMWGGVSDVFGRRAAYLGTALVTTCVGLASAFAPSFTVCMIPFTLCIIPFTLSYTSGKFASFPCKTSLLTRKLALSHNQSYQM